MRNWFHSVAITSTSAQGSTALYDALHAGYRKISKIKGRKAFVHGTMHDGETLCAEAEGIFVSARPGSMQELMEQREAWETEHKHEP